MQKAPLKIRIIETIISTIYGLTILFCLVTIFFAILSSTGTFIDSPKMSFQLPIEIPIKSDAEHNGRVRFCGQEVELADLNASGKVEIKNAPKSLAIISSILYAITTFFAVFIMHLLYRFVSNVKKGVVFEKENLKLLRKLGYTLLGFYFFNLLVPLLWKLGFEIDGHATNFSLHIDGSSLATLISALFILMISQLFLHGLEMKNENELTI
jgi:hypothetical protein